jgi:hypothetical protein
MIAGMPDGASVDGRPALSGNFRTRSTELWIDTHKDWKVLPHGSGHSDATAGAR